MSYLPSDAAAGSLGLQFLFVLLAAIPRQWRLDKACSHEILLLTYSKSELIQLKLVETLKLKTEVSHL